MNAVKRARRGGRKSGFTLSETLVTLGIVAILLAVAVPNVVNLRYSLKMNELDSCARQIFIAAQNTLTGAAGAGRTDALKTAGTPQDPVTPALYYVTQDSVARDTVLPNGAIDPAVAAQHYLILYDPASATVVEVFYAESEFSPMQAFALSGSGSEQAAARRKAMLGYYNGSNLDREPVVQLPAPELTLIDNNETLAVEARIPLSMLGAGMTPANLELTVTVRNPAREDAVKAFAIPLQADGKAQLVLDSLRGKRFAEQFPEFDTETFTALFPPACDLLISARLDYVGSDTLWLPGVSVETPPVNSLFASRTDDAETGVSTVSITTARHLQNLSESYSALLNSDINALHAVQQAEISWPADLNFQPIDSAYLLTEFNGGTLPIRGLRPVASPKTKGVGMFGTIIRTQKAPLIIEGVRLADPYVRNDNSNIFFAGTLAGQLDYCVVRDCLVYAEEDIESSGLRSPVFGSSSGGLIGKTDGTTVTACGVGLPLLQGAEVGGLIGTANGSTIVSSYAAIDGLIGSSSAAMFLGSGSGNRVEDCYAVGVMQADLTRGDAYSGFTNAVAGVFRSYCAVTYVDQNGEPLVSPDGMTGVNGFAPAKAVYGTQASCAFLLPASLPAWHNDNATPLSYRELTQWAAGGTRWTALDRPLSHPYRGTLRGKAYPFPGLLGTGDTPKPIPHYGSWPDAPASVDGVRLAYAETYKTAAPGVYTVGSDGAPIDTLQADHIHSVAYGLLLPAGTPLVSLFESPGWVRMGGNALQSTDFAVTGMISVTLGQQAYDFYPATQILANRVPNYTVRGVSFEIGADRFWFHPGFAAAVTLDAQKDALGTETLPYQIRVPMQLKRMCDSPDMGETLFLQTHDIYFYDGDAWQPSPKSLGAKEVFDGGRFSIFGLPQPLFKAIGSGAAQNVILQNAHIVNASNTGVFAFTSEGTIRDSSVVDSKIFGSQSLSGFLDNASGGTIEGCAFYATKSYDDAVVESAQSAFGFARAYSGALLRNCFATGTVTAKNGDAAGLLSENSTLVQSCYANCIVTGSASASGLIRAISGYGAQDCYAAGAVHSSGGFAGGFSASAVTATRCYSIARVSSYYAGWAYGFSMPGTVKDCYYLSGDGLTAGAGSKLDYNALAALSLGAAWGGDGLDAVPYTSSLRPPYPFPSLSDLPHYGDWAAAPADFPQEDDYLGVFSYERVSGNRYRISAVGLKLDLTKSNIPRPAQTDLVNPFCNGTYTVDTSIFDGVEGADGFAQSGYGMFFKRQPNNELTAFSNFYADNSGNAIAVSSIYSEQRNLKIDPTYVFSPAFPKAKDPVIQLQYRHDSGSSPHNWSVTLTYDENTDKFTAAIS